MKTKIIVIFIYLIGIINASSQVQDQKEVVLIGTMHTVPKIVKHSYKPMLKMAIKYNPDGIYAESPRANDTLSWEYLKDGWSENYKNFYYLSDSIKKDFTPDTNKFNTILKKDFKRMSKKDLDYLTKTFAFKRDHVNYEYYSYLQKHGPKGAKKPTRHEDGDLTFKLALSENIKLIKSMDDQRTNGAYHKAWSKCAKEGTDNGNNAANSKMYKKNYNSSILPAIFRGLGKHTNKKKSLKRLDCMASFTYVKVETPGCKQGLKYWEERNYRMAKNIAEQVLKSENQKNIVIVGASHIIGLEKELKKNYPELKVVLMND